MRQDVRNALDDGVVIPASPLALNADRSLNEQRQRAVWRYYSDAGAGGIAVAVHTTQFAIRRPEIGLHRPLLALAQDELDRLDMPRAVPMIRVAGVCGATFQAVTEATLSREHGFHLALLNLGAMKGATIPELVQHCRSVGEILPLFGFYLQPAVGGVVLPYEFWRAFLELDTVVAIKVAAFNRYQTTEVVRAVADSGRSDVALYTGNDDNILVDLMTSYQFAVDGRQVARRFVGGLLGQWACWTRRAVELLEQCKSCRDTGAIRAELLTRNIELTDANGALFDAGNEFAGCIAGIHEVLKRQGLFAGSWCLDPKETLSPGQAAEIDRVCRQYPHLTDDCFVAENLDRWLEQ